MIAAILAVVLVVASLAAGITSTLAKEPDKPFRFQQPDRPTTINGVLKVGSPFTIPREGLNAVKVMDQSLGTSELKGGDFVFTAAKAGLAQFVRVQNSSTLSLAYDFQVVDPAAITGYNLPNGGNGYVSKVSATAIDLGITYYKSNVPVFPTSGNPPWAPNETNLKASESNYDGSGSVQAALRAQVKWSSLDNTIIEVVGIEAGSQTIYARAEGITLLVGEFTDRWGEEQHIHYLFGVGQVPGKQNTNLNALLDAIRRGKAILNIYDGGDPSHFDPALIADLRSAINEALTDIDNGTESKYVPDTTKINDLCDQITGQGGGVKPPFVIDPPTGFQPPYPPGTKLRPLTWPKNVYEVLTPGGESQQPKPEYIYDPSGKLGKTPPVWDDKVVPAYTDGTLFYAEETPPGNIFNPITGEGALNKNAPIWGGADGRPGGGDDRPAYKNTSLNKWYAEDPPGSNLWKPLVNGNNRQLDPDPLTWIGGGSDGKPDGNNDLYKFTVKYGQVVAGKFNDGTNDYYVAPGLNGRFDTSGDSNGKPVYNETSGDDVKVYDGGSGWITDPPTGLKPAIGLTLTPTSIPALAIGASEIVTVAKDPLDTTDTLSVSGNTNPAVATAVIESGNVKVTGVAAGTAMITVTLGSKSETIAVTVQAAVVPPSVTITGFMADSGYLKANGTNATLTGKILVMDDDTGDESWVAYDAATHGGTLAWALNPAGQSAALSGTGNKFLKTTTGALGTTITVKGTLTTASGTYTSIGYWTVINSDGSIGGGAEHEPIGVKGRELTVTESGQATKWYEIARTVIDGKSFSLILRDKVIGIGDSNQSNMQTAINQWWANNDKIPMTSPLRQYTYKPTLPAGTYGTSDGGQANNGHNGIDGSGYFATGWSYPNPSQQVIAENDTAFLLSYAEAAKFCSTKFYNNNLKTDVGSCDVAQQNWGRLSDRGSTYWWLRSPGTGSYTSHVITSGVLSGNYDVTFGPSTSLRPALWVSSDIFN